MSEILDSNEKVWRTAENVVTRKIADETILVPISGNLADMQRIFTVNEVGAAVWALMDGAASLTSIKRFLLDEFDVNEEQLENDLAEFVDNLIKFGLVVETPEDVM